MIAPIVLSSASLEACRCGHRPERTVGRAPGIPAIVNFSSEFRFLNLSVNHWSDFETFITAEPDDCNSRWGFFTNPSQGFGVVLNFVELAGFVSVAPSPEPNVQEKLHEFGFRFRHFGKLSGKWKTGCISPFKAVSVLVAVFRDRGPEGRNVFRLPDINEPAAVRFRVL